MSFVDRVNVVFKAGDGGNGIVSFRHEKFRQFGGPDGGDGGSGGDIFLVASHRENTLSNLRYKKLIQAGTGQAGTRAKRHGKNAPDLLVAVPVGTVVLAGNETLADLTQEDQKIIVAKGGNGGYGNAHFVSSTRQAPRLAEKGEPGEKIEATLELKMIADIGIIGLPNAGKSTLLSVISNAKPTIANYPFTTLVPNLGVVDIDDKTSLLFADIPGLIEGASQGKGLGDEFLRHIERTRLLIHLIDIYSEDIVRDYQTIIKELRDYRVDLSDRPQIVVLTKTEGIPPVEVAKKIKTLGKSMPKNTPLLAISAQSGTGIKPLLAVVRQLINKKPKALAKPKVGLPVIGLREDEFAWSVQKTEDGFVVSGQKIERFAKRTIFGDYHAEQRLRDIMHKMGIGRELERLGIESGATITFGKPKIGQIEY